MPYEEQVILQTIRPFNGPINHVTNFSITFYSTPLRRTLTKQPPNYKIQMAARMIR